MPWKCLFFGIALLASGCVRPPLKSELPPTLSAWRAALSNLAALRTTAVGSEPRTLKLSLALREPVTGRRTEARGAVAISPSDRAVRMILVGPGGTTAFDLWIRADKFRVSIPAIDLLRRGDASTPRAETRGLPVDFLRFWFLDLTAGALLWVEKLPQNKGELDVTAPLPNAPSGVENESRFTLRDGPAVITLAAQNEGPITARRQTWLKENDDDEVLTLVDEEKVSADKVGCGRALYSQASTGVEIEIKCEGIEPSPPSDRAFTDPDEVEEE